MSQIQMCYGKILSKDTENYTATPGLNDSTKFNCISKRVWYYIEYISNKFKENMAK